MAELLAKRPTKKTEVAQQPAGKVTKVQVGKIFEVEFRALGASKEEQDKIRREYEGCVKELTDAMATKWPNTPMDKISEDELVSFLAKEFNSRFETSPKEGGLLAESVLEKTFTCSTFSILMADALTREGKTGLRLLVVPGHVLLAGKHRAFETAWMPGCGEFEERYPERQEAGIGELLAITYNHVGAMLSELGKHEDALEAYDNALALNTKDPEVWNNKGITLRDQGRHGDALKAFGKAIELYPKYPKAWSNKGVALRETGRLAEALDSYNHAIELDPKYAGAWNNKGNVLRDMGRFEDALAAYGKAIEFDPKSPVAWNNKGIALTMMGRGEEAQECFKKAEGLGRK